MGELHRLLELIDELPRDLESLRIDRVVDPAAVAPPTNKSGATKHPQMLRDPRLAVGQSLFQMADTERAPCGNESHELEPHGVREGAKDVKRQIARFRHNSRYCEGE